MTRALALLLALIIGFSPAAVLAQTPSGGGGGSAGGGSGGGLIEVTVDPQEFTVANPTTAPDISRKAAHNLGNKTGSFAVDFNNGLVQHMVLTGNITITGFDNKLDAGWHCLGITQDATGSRTVSWPSVNWTDNLEPTIASGANRTTTVCMFAAGGALWGGTGVVDAPANAPYWTGASVAGLSAEHSLAGITALVISTLGTPSAYAGTTCAATFPRSLSALGVADCQKVANADMTNSSVTLTGTANRITITGGGPLALGGSATFNLPQDIHTAATPTFASLVLTSFLPPAQGGTGSAITATAGRTIIANGSVFVLSSGADTFCTDAVGTDAYACSFTIAPTAYVTGGVYFFKAGAANTGAASININGLGVRAIKKQTGGISTDLADNDIRAGAIVALGYDGTEMQMLSVPGNAAVPGGSSGQVQVNIAGVFTGDSGFTYNTATDTVTVGGVNVTGPDSGSVEMVTAAMTAGAAAAVKIGAHTGNILVVSEDNGAVTALLKVLSRTTDVIDHGTALSTSLAKRGTVAQIPATCSVGMEYFATNATPGSNKYLCTATNTWTQQTGSSAGTFDGIGSGTNVSATMTCGSGCAFGVSGTGTNNATHFRGNTVVDEPDGGTGNSTYTKGDVLVASSATVLAKLPIGSPGDRLVADPAASTGVAWKTVPYHCIDAGSTDAYACNLAPAITSYTNGMLVSFFANTANTTAASLALNGLAAKTIKKASGGSIATDIATNDIRAGQYVLLSYDGTNWQMQSTLGNTPSGGADVAGSYLQVGLNSTNTADRQFTPRDMLVATDAGANGNYTLDADWTDSSVIQLRDEFCGGSTTTAQIGELGWNFTSVGGGAAVTKLAGTDTNPCQMRIQTSATSGQGTVMYLLNPSATGVFTPGTVGSWKMKIIFKLSHTTSIRTRIGFTDTTSAAQPPNGIWLRYDVDGDTGFSDTTFKFCMRHASGTEACEDTSVAADTSLHTLVMQSTTAGTITAVLDGGSTFTLTSADGTVPTAVMNPSLIVVTDTTAERDLDIDLFAFNKRVSR